MNESFAYASGVQYVKPKIRLEGVIAAMVTPFQKNGDLNIDAMKTLVEWLISKGVQGIFPISSVGETAKLTMEEKKRLIRVTVDSANGRALVMPGTGFPDQRRTEELTKYAKEVGADAALIVQPYYQRPSAEILYDYFKAINDAVNDFPLLLYNIPFWCGYELSPEMISTLSRLRNIVGVKDSGMNMINFNLTLHLVRKKIAVLQGADMLFLPSLVLGCPGGILAGANIVPELELEIYNSFIKGNLEDAKAMHDALLPLWLALEDYGSFPSLFKEAVAARGIPVGPARKPARPPTLKQKERLRQVLMQLQVVEG